MFQKCRKLFRNERKVSKFSQETTPRIRRSSQGGCGRSNISCISISFLVLKFLEKAKFVYRPHRRLWSSFYTLSHRFLVNGWVTGIREFTIRQGLAPRRQTWQRVDWIEYFVFRANFDRYERARTVRTSLAGTSRPHTNCCC